MPEPITTQTGAAAPEAGSGLASGPTARDCAERACAQAERALGGKTADLVMVFFSPHFVDHAREISEVVGATLFPRTLIGASAESVLGGARELEGQPAVSVLALRLPGVRISTFTADDLPPPADTPEARDAMVRALDAGPAHRATIFFCDPFSSPLIRLLPAMSRALEHVHAGPLLGGVASAGASPGGNALLLDGRVHREGAVGVSLSGPVRVDTLVSQGCRPFGPTFVVTKSKNNLVQRLGGKSALAALKHAAADLSDEQRERLSGGLFLGIVTDEYKERFGRGDYLIRPVLAADQDSGSLAIGDMVRTGQTVRFHVRDAATASEDLALLLDAQRLHAPPIGALLVTCNGRGEALFDTPNHDAAAVSRAFAQPETGASKALGGAEVGAPRDTIPLAGFFAAGEIAPIGPRSFLHGQTAALAVFRKR